MPAHTIVQPNWAPYPINGIHASTLTDHFVGADFQDDAHEVFLEFRTRHLRENLQHQRTCTVCAMRQLQWDDQRTEGTQLTQYVSVHAV